ncbi:hypothetical protein B0H16DRAFT_1734531 [Mycena metata]|uniref:Uncharacterized protein n=1 Tax=Mycena metata TaxID=1033252 RepID=A0AAD7HUM7_9AGAR|nr:hypothetical protein B0H16DRAFT_1734531 [Mycena metata]
MHNPRSGILPALGACLPRDVSSLRGCGSLCGFPIAYHGRLASFLFTLLPHPHTLPPLRPVPLAPLTAMPTHRPPRRPEEKRQDAIRAQINVGHRFDSFVEE